MNLKKFQRINLLRNKQLDTSGFTIVELMVALSVMSIILVISTIVLIQIGGLYDKGVSASNLQNTARSIVADMSSAIQFSGVSDSVSECAPSAPPSGIVSWCYPPSSGYPYTYTFSNNNKTYEYSYCIGTTRYTYILNTELGQDVDQNSTNGIGVGGGSPAGQTTQDILWRDTLKLDGDPCIPVDLSNPTANSSSPFGNQYAVPGSGYEMMGAHTRLTKFTVTSLSGAGTGNVYQITINSAFGSSGEFNANGVCQSQINLLSSQFCSSSSITSTIGGRLN